MADTHAVSCAHTDLRGYCIGRIGIHVHPQFFVPQVQIDGIAHPPAQSLPAEDLQRHIQSQMLPGIKVRRMSFVSAQT